jgi:LysM repeat protein
MSLQPRWQMVQLVALLAFTAAAWIITVSARAAGPSEAIIAKADADGATADVDGGPGPESAAEPETRPAPKTRGAAAKPSAAAEPPEVLVYVVQPGDSLSEIAEAHGVRVADVVAANGISNPDDVDAGTELKIPGTVAPAPKGKKAPEGVRITVPRGVTLSRIAEVYGIPWKRIAKANGLARPDRVRAGQKLFIPGATQVLEIVPCLKRPVALYRVRTDETHSVSLCRCNGEPNPEALEVLSALSGPPRQAAPFPLHPRLAQLLQHVADEFPGKRLEIISGQRPRKATQKNESLHNKGQAIDFRVEGVPNARLVAFVRSFDSVGVGYYPNSVFIHLDTRTKDGYWIDYSRPGEKAIYGKAGMKADEIEKIRLARRAETAVTSDVEADVDVGSLADLIAASVADALAPPAPASPAAPEASAPTSPEPPVDMPIAANVTPES